MRRSAAAVIVLAATLALAAVTSPLAGAKPRGPTARAWVALDAGTGNVLLSQRAHERRPIASLTKVMTGLLVAEAGDLQRRIRVPLAATQVEPTNEGLRPGGRYRRLTLLYSTMLVSANDSATALGYDLGAGSLERFYALMNARGARIGMRETMYASASGLDDFHNSSTAYDQALLARTALLNPAFRQVVSTRRYFTRWSAPDARQGVGEPQQNALHASRHLRCQDRLDVSCRCLRCGRRAARRSYGDRGRARLEGALARHRRARRAGLRAPLASRCRMFVTFEGLDGSGKTTQQRLVAELLRADGLEVVETREPGGTELGERVRELVLHAGDVAPWAEAALFAASRAQHVAEVIRPALDRGAAVLCDRYVDSSLAYQGIARGLGLERVLELNLTAVDGLLPERTFLLLVAATTAAGRMSADRDRIERESLAFQERVDAAYRELAELYPERIVALDGALPPEVLAERIHGALRNGS